MATNPTMHVTKEFICAVETASEALRTQAEAVLREVIDPATNIEPGGTVDRACRTQAERKHQLADLLDGWSDRYREAIGMEKRRT